MHNQSSLLRLVQSDPGLPRNNATHSYWQREPHPLASTKSESLPEQCDYAIIGSGITGTSVAKTLLEGDPSGRIIMLEARTLCSGATGRNGGQLVTNAGEEFASLAMRFGHSMAAKIFDFTIRAVRRTHEMVEQYAKDKCDFRKITKVRAYMDRDSFEKMKLSIKSLEENSDMAKEIFSIVEDSQKIYEDFGVANAHGALLFEAFALWPYKFVTSVLESLEHQYKGRFGIETMTPVIAVRDGPNASLQYHEVHTARGIIRAKHVIYCTNAYSAHLVPNLRGLIFPVRGTMSVQDLHGRVVNRGHHISWSIHGQPEVDPSTGAIADGLCYMTQHPATGYFYFGGDKATIEHELTADDTKHVASSVEYLRDWLPRFFGLDADGFGKADVVSSWTGIMGFTADGVPLVGRLPEQITEGSSKAWIAAGFNGYGMPYCWLAGQSLAEMVLAQQTPSWFPEAFSVTPPRLATSLTAEKSASSVLAMVDCHGRKIST